VEANKKLLPVVNSYDLFALKTGKQESLFELACTGSDVDII